MDGPTDDVVGLVERSFLDRIEAHTAAAGQEIADQLEICRCVVHRTRVPVPDAPTLYLLTITPDNDDFIGMDTPGTVWTSPDGALDHHARIAGQVEALIYVGGSAPWMLFADERGIVATDDYGAIVTVSVPYGDASESTSR